MDSSQQSGGSHKKGAGSQNRHLLFEIHYPLITDPVPHSWDPAPFLWDPPLCWEESMNQTLFKCYTKPNRMPWMLENPWSAVRNTTCALGPLGSRFGPSSLAPVGIHHLLPSNLTTGRKLPEINTKNCSLSIVLTATDQNPQKSLKRWYYPPSHCLNVNVMLSNMTFLMIFAGFDPSPLTLWINCSF